MQNQKSLLLLLVFFSLLSWYSQVMATHAVGADMTFACGKTSCTRIFYYSIYVNCATANGLPTSPASPTFSCGNSPQPLGPWTILSDVEITPLCPGQASQCTNPNSPVPGIRQVISRRTYDFCTGSQICSSYTMRWGLCCRNAGINSLTNSSNQSMGGELKIPFSTQSCDRSPVFNTYPIVRVCTGQNNTFSQGATDPDGNTLQYSMVNCSQNGSTNVVYAAGFSAASPLGSSWNVTLNPNNGNLNFQPNPGNAVVGVICVRVSEVDGQGNVIGYVVRDIQVTAAPCNNNLPVLTGPTIANACVGKESCIDVTASDADLNDQITVSVVSNNIGATIQTTNGQGGGAHICFTPTAVGSYSVILQVADNHCPVIGVQQFTYTFAVTACDPCDAAAINMSWTHIESLLVTEITNTSTANTNGGPSFTTFVWGDGSPNTVYSGNYGLPVSHTYAAPGWYTVCVILEVYVDNICCHDTLCRDIYISDDPCDFFDASFTATQTGPCGINFHSTSTAGASNIYWDFGDGSPVASGINVSHTFATGTWTVTLTVMWHPTEDPNFCCTSIYTETYNINCVHSPSGGEVKRVTHASVGYVGETEQALLTLGAEADLSRDATLELYDLSGKLLQRAELSAGTRQGRLHLSGYANGLYLVRISAGTHVETIKFLKY